ncbi:MAG: hypothetical protein QQN45_07140, partial [Nitrosopumilus sp.]
KASDVHREGYAHKMIGHGGYLPQYDRMSDEKKLDWFLELEPKLIIDSTVRLREENKLKEQKIKKLESEKDIQLKDMQSQIDTVMKLLDRKENLNSS